MGFKLVSIVFENLVSIHTINILVYLDFYKLCMGASETHFQDFDEQLEHIREDIYHMKLGSNRRDANNINVGDVYVSRHSNLSETHVVFHIVVDDSIKSPEINSRHQVILGLRNILKMCYIYDIAHISIPLLLMHTMSEDITIQWCLRRAELVLKCVKGFMIEMSSLLSLNDNENKTIQFVVPKVSDSWWLNSFLLMITLFVYFPPEHHTRTLHLAVINLPEHISTIEPFVSNHKHCLISLSPCVNCTSFYKFM